MIKSNNPHLAGGEKVTSCSGPDGATMHNILTVPLGCSAEEKKHPIKKPRSKVTLPLQISSDSDKL